MDSPLPQSTRITHVAANYIEIAWVDDSFGSYLYDIQIKNLDAVTPAYETVVFGYTGSSYYLSELASLTTYQIRIRLRIPLPGFTPSDWVELDPETTFETNSFSVQAQENVFLYDEFVSQRFTLDNKDYVDFNSDGIRANLVRESFSFKSSDTIIDDIEDDLMIRSDEQLIYGNPPSNFGFNDSTFIGYWDGYVYAFQDDSNKAYFSNDRGASWTQYTLFTSEKTAKPTDGRGFKVGVNSATLMGKDYIYSGRTFGTQLSWSNTTKTFSNTVDTFAKIESEFNEIGGGGDILSFSSLWKLPISITGNPNSYDLDSEWIAVGAGGYIWKQNRLSPVRDPMTEEFVWDTPIEHRIDAVLKHFTWFDGYLYYIDEGDLVNGEVISVSGQTGVWRMDPNTDTLEQVFLTDETDLVQVTALTRNDSELVISLDPVTSDKGTIDFAVPFRRTYISTNGTTWLRRNEKFTYEAFYTYLPQSGYRIFLDQNINITAIEPSINYNMVVDGSENFSETGRLVFNIPNVSFTGWPGFAVGVVYSNAVSGELIGFYEFPWRIRSSVETDLVNDLFAVGELSSITRGTTIDVINGVPVRINDPKPGVEHLLEKIAPETYVHDSPRFGEFMRTYLRYISDPSNNGYYSDLSNFMDNQDVNKSVLVDLFETDLTSRNIRLTNDTRDEFIRFVNNRAQDWWGIRGTIDSYKYLFKTLYNENVEIEAGQESDIETSFILDADNGYDVANELPGKRISAVDKRFYGYVNYVQEIYSEGKRVWKVVLQNSQGGVEISDRIVAYRFTDTLDKSEEIGSVVKPISSRVLSGSQREFFNRGRSFYILRIKSSINSNRYLRDVIQLVHPVGFNIEAVFLMVLFVNAGLTLGHETTIIDKLLTYTWDLGIPKFTPPETAILDLSGDYVYDDDGWPLTTENPNGDQSITPSSEYYTDNPDVIYGLTTEERRRDQGPLFDNTLTRFVNFERNT